MRGFVIAAAVSLVATGCSEEDAAKSAAYGSAREPRRPDAVASPPSAATPAAASGIPAAFLGVWDYVKGSCDPASDLRVEIGPRAIGFYESQGEVTKVTIESADAIVVDLAMEGEGESWTMATRYTLSDGGRTLTPTDAKGGSGEPMPLKKCPAEVAR